MLFMQRQFNRALLSLCLVLVILMTFGCTSRNTTQNATTQSATEPIKESQAVTQNDEVQIASTQNTFILFGAVY